MRIICRAIPLLLAGFALMVWGRAPARALPLADADSVPLPGTMGWRGNWTGRFPAADPVTAWDIDRGINVLWRVPTKRYANAMPIIVGDRLFVLMEPRILICLDKMTGKLLWANDGSGVEPIRDAAQLDELIVERDGPTDPAWVPWSRRKLSYGANAGTSIPTPVTDGKRIWTKAGGGAACFDLDGNRLWATNTNLAATDHPQNVPSPVLIGNVLVCEGGATPYWEQQSGNKVPDGLLPTNPNKFKHWMVGLNATTGEILWDLGPLNAGGYGGASSPMPLTLHKDRDTATFVLTGEGHLVRPEDGKLIVAYVGARSTFASPFPLGQRAVFTHVGSISMVEFALLARDRVDCRVVWSTRNKGTMGGSVYHDGVIYTLTWENTAVLQAIDAASGAVLYSQPLPVSAVEDSVDWCTPASAGKYLYMFYSRQATVIEPGNPSWLVAVSGLDRMHSGPVFDGDRMYLRTYDSILCIARKGEEGAAYEKQVQARTLLAAFPERVTPRTLKELAPPVGFTPGAGAPVVKLEPGKLPRNWLVAGPFPITADGRDPLESMGGCVAARPAKGTTVTLGETTGTFAPIGRAAVANSGLNLLKLTGDQRGMQAYCYTVLDVPEETLVRVETSQPCVQLWLAGEPVDPQMALKLAPGRYPVLLKVTVDENTPAATDPWLQLAFHTTLPPAVEAANNLAFVRAHLQLLQRVIDLAPGSASATRASELLAAIQ